MPRGASTAGWVSAMNAEKPQSSMFSWHRTTSCLSPSRYLAGSRFGTQPRSSPPAKVAAPSPRTRTVDRCASREPSVHSPPSPENPSSGASARRSWRGRDLRARATIPRPIPGLLCVGSSGRLRREDREPRMMATSTRSSVRTRIACVRTAEPSPRRRHAPSVRPSDRAFYDITTQRGAVAESDTRVPHWFGPAGDRPVEIPTILGRKGERIHARVAPRRTSATG